MAYPFHWVPSENRRHASMDQRQGCAYPTGTVVRTLCTRDLVADNSGEGWLWPTCEECGPEARRIATEHDARPKGVFG